MLSFQGVVPNSPTLASWVTCRVGNQENEERAETANQGVGKENKDGPMDGWESDPWPLQIRRVWVDN